MACPMCRRIHEQGKGDRILRLTPPLKVMLHMASPGFLPSFAPCHPAGFFVSLEQSNERQEARAVNTAGYIRKTALFTLASIGMVALFRPGSGRAASPDSDPWPSNFQIVRIPSSRDGATQAAYFFRAGRTAIRPLVVSLHTWSGDFRQEDTLAVLARGQNWNYIHPDFRGPNRSPDACLSEKALSDIDDAIDYALAHANCDTGNIFIIGVSGGGYATLGAYMRSRHHIKGFSAWASIADLEAWYYESQIRKNKYADDVLACLDRNGEFDAPAARERSPLYWETPDRKNSRLDIYAGINDGYTGSVPITHSLFFYNKIARDLGCSDPAHLASAETILSLLKYRRLPSPKKYGRIGNRRIIYGNHYKNVSVTIFDGTHEMLPVAAFQSLVRQAGER